MTTMIRTVLLFAVIALASGRTPSPSSRADSVAARIASALCAAYPDFIDSVASGRVYWRDGTRMALGDTGASHDFAAMAPEAFRRLLDTASIADQFAIPYPLHADIAPPQRNADPGRIRNDAFFLKMYGDTPAKVRARLARVAWLPRHHGGSLRMTTINGVDRRLAAVSRALDALPDAMIAFLIPTGGTFNWRAVRGGPEKRLSAHAFGIAIDIRVARSDYWLWHNTLDATSIPYLNRIPKEIVDIFEKHGFIWGGRWYHYDTMHFEYRPEMANSEQ